MDVLKKRDARSLFLHMLSSERLLLFYEKASFEVAYTKKSTSPARKRIKGFEKLCGGINLYQFPCTQFPTGRNNP